MAAVTEIPYSRVALNLDQFQNSVKVSLYYILFYPVPSNLLKHHFKIAILKLFYL